MFDTFLKSVERENPKIDKKNWNKLFKQIKEMIAGVIGWQVCDEKLFNPVCYFVVETLSQSGKSVTLFFQTLSASEQRHSLVEKEAYAIAIK